MINITPCIRCDDDSAWFASALACNDDDLNYNTSPDFEMGAHKMRQRMLKVQVRQLPVNTSMNMPQDEEEGFKI
eukprot:CAMPEP_0196827474 /NCGR_PEP_ID=MMETSP1362-20130617/94179_1 /TAXON_ID=163516 /ORGANISM="Leptocylindrus danicus, Strain CCMP1856" /LENGTH=73 /DNA_ID=CAMNT_0042208113 /DNA_START=475 /DNA_END=696 /DNA_ORIENTATION=-